MASEDSYYPSVDEDESPPADKPEPGDKAEKADTESSLVPMSFLGGEKEVGDVCKIKVVAIHDGEVEIEYVKHDKDSDDSEDSDSDSDDMDIAGAMESGKMGI